jgi:hypothetical protein
MKTLTTAEKIEYLWLSKALVTTNEAGVLQHPTDSKSTAEQSGPNVDGANGFMTALSRLSKRKKDLEKLTPSEIDVLYTRERNASYLESMVSRPIPALLEPIKSNSLLPIESADTHQTRLSLGSVPVSACFPTATERKVAYLIKRRSLGDALRHEKAAKEAHLLALPVHELDELCVAEFERMREQIEKWRFYRKPDASASFADLANFHTLGYWTCAETVAYLLGKNPDKVNHFYLKEFMAQDEQEYTEFQTLEIPDSRINHYFTSRYMKLSIWLSRAKVFIPATRKVDPVAVFRAARAAGFLIPVHMANAFEEKEPQSVQELDAKFLATAMPGLHAAPVVTSQTEPGKPAIDTPRPVVVTTAKRPGWFEHSNLYIVDVLRTGQFATCKELYSALYTRAGPDTPFEKGTATNRGSLYVRDIASTLSLKTVQNKWQVLRNLARN